MSQQTVAVVRELYERARKGSPDEVAEMIAEDATWHGVDDRWKPCTTGEEVLKTLMWRSHANRLRVGETIDLGDRVLVQVRGARLERLGAKGLFPKLFQIVTVRSDRVVAIRDYARREDALAAAGLHA